MHALQRLDEVRYQRGKPGIKRRAARVVWLNPLLGNPSYEPLTRGMAAAMPLIDDFAPGHNLASLRDLAGKLHL